MPRSSAFSFFDEPIDALSGTGIAVIIFAGLAASLETKRRRKAEVQLSKKLSQYEAQAAEAQNLKKNQPN